MNRLDHTLGNISITNITTFLPAGILSKNILDGQVEKIKSTVSVDKKNLRVKLETLNTLSESDESISKEDGAIIDINEDEFVIVCSILLMNNHQPTLVTGNGGSCESVLSPIEKAKELGFAILKRYYPVPEGGNIQSGEHYDVVVDVETQSIVSFKRGFSFKSVEKINEKQVAMTMRGANGGLNVKNAPIRIGGADHYEPIGTQSYHQDFQSLFISNTNKIAKPYSPFVSAFDYDRSRFGKVWVNMEPELIIKKLKSPRVKLEGNTSTFFSWWFNTPLVDNKRKEGETPVVFKMNQCRDGEDQLYTTEPLDVNTVRCELLYNGLLPRTVGEKWSKGLTPDEIAHALIVEPLRGEKGRFSNIDSLYFYEGEEHIADAIARLIHKNKITRELNEVDAEIAELELRRSQLLGKLKTK